MNRDEGPRGSAVWDEAARELGLELVRRPNRLLGGFGRMSGVVDGFEIIVRKQNHGESMRTSITVRFPEPIGPPGLELKRVGGRHKGPPTSGRRTRFGWYTFTGTVEHRALRAKAEDPQELATWMTVDRIDALLALALPGNDVVIEPGGVRSHLPGGRGGSVLGTASSLAIIYEVRRILSLATRLT